MGLIRFLLSIGVVIVHSAPFFGIELTHGVAVPSFFIISGFYMALVLDKKYTGSGAYKSYITQRLMKIFPFYWVMCSLIVVVSAISYIATDNGLSLQPYIDYIGDMNIKTTLFLIIANIVILFQDLVLFLGLDLETGSLYLTEYYNSTPPFIILC